MVDYEKFMDNSRKWLKEESYVIDKEVSYD